jgi:hypothetical protein
MRHLTSTRSRAVIAAFVGLLVLAAAGRAEAQTGTGGSILTGSGGTSGNSVLQSSDFFLGIEQTPPVSLTTFELARFFNKARCDCSAPVSIFISLLPSGVAKRSQVTAQTGTVSVILGPGCSTLLNQQIGNCVPVPGGSEQVLTFLNQGKFEVPTNARFLSNYLNASTTFDGGASVTGCQANNIGQFTQTANILFDYDGDGIVDLALTMSLLIDLTPPPAPTGVTVRGGDEALIMNWDPISTAVVPDLLGYQILCSRADQFQVFKGTDNDGGGVNGGPFAPAFQTCPSTRTGTGVENLDPAFVCSGQLTAQATSDRVEILQNDITYAAAVVAVDNSGNASEPRVLFGTPIKTLSFYDVYRGQTPQGEATGGFCALSTAPAGAKGTGAALGLFAVGSVVLAVRRHRRRKGRR